MISLNRGEWSELYSVLFLLVKPKLNIVNSNLEPIEEAKNLFVLKEIISKSKISLNYKLVNDTVLIYIDDQQYNKMNIEEVEANRKKLIDAIRNYDEQKGAFTIPSLNEFIKSFSNNNNFKTGSCIKDDIELVLIDSRQSKDVSLTYSIKSSLGSPATILNSSNNTNFKYRVENISEKQIPIINSIKTRTKLLDRINKIDELGGKIKFDSIPSPTFEYNLKMVDSNMPEYLANALLFSYQKNDKDLKNVFINSNNFSDEKMAIKKLGDLISAISFGFFPGEKWDGKNTVTGGLLIVNENGDVCVIDLVYYKEEVINFLINESKLDSPSSTRYHMLELEEVKGEIFFTLNLQIRYKK